MIAGLPKVAELIATVPGEKQELPLEAVEQRYLNTAREWAVAVMLRLRAEAAEADMKEVEPLV